MMLQRGPSNTLIQTIIARDKRGHTMSHDSMALLGLAPLGGLVGGVLASRIGVPMTIRTAGIISWVGALVFRRQLPRRRELVRPIYENVGIVPGPIQPSTPNEY